MASVGGTCIGVVVVGSSKEVLCLPYTCFNER